MVKCVSILGSTGSIGRQTLDVVSRLPGVRVGALTAGKSVDRMEAQCRTFLPELAVMATQEAARALADRIPDLPIRVAYGEAGLMEAAALESTDCVITAVVGMVGLKPTLAAIRAGKRIGLANKETLWSAPENWLWRRRKSTEAKSFPWTRSIPPSFSALWAVLTAGK